MRAFGVAAERGAFIAQFAGSDRFVVDYLGEEVLQAQTVEIQDFLLRTSILERLSGSLCDAILGHKGSSQCDSQVTLEALERANLFVVPLDRERRWYRYHQLLADVLRARLPSAQTSSRVCIAAHTPGWNVLDT